jgi:hypothetical protein
MIPTEEMVDPDAESHEVLAKTNAQAKAPATPAKAETVKTVPAVQKPAEPKQPEKPAEPVNPVLQYLAKEREELRKARNISAAENAAIWKKQTEILKGANLAPNKALSSYTQEEATALVQRMYTNFTPTGTELLNDDGKTA